MLRPALSKGNVSSPRLYVLLAYFGCCLIWGSTWMMIKIGLRGAPPLTSIAVRMTIASAIVAVIIALARIRVPRDARFVRLGVFVGFFQVILPYTFVYYGEQRIPSGLAAVLYATFPLLVAVLARFWLSSPLTTRKLAGVAVGIIGVAVIFSDNLRLGYEQAAGTAMVMGSVMASAIGSVGTKKWGHGDHPIASLLIPFATSALVMTGLALSVESPLELDFDRATWGTIFYLAAVGSVGAFACFFYVMQRLDVTVVSYQTFIIPIVAVLLGATFLGESISSRVGMGAALILAGISLATFMRPRRST
ncbi:MAG TPA: EamA family transporter [Candidatus Krumholzibacteria bacterium]|nr:EamA family transporter [Candidatus Krumholzibacteria bacterium]